MGGGGVGEGGGVRDGLLSGDYFSLDLLPPLARLGLIVEKLGKSFWQKLAVTAAINSISFGWATTSCAELAMSGATMNDSSN